MENEAIKKKYGKVYELRVKDETGEDLIGYLTIPTRAVMGAIMSTINRDPIAAMEVMLSNCLIKEISDMRILEDDEMFYSAIPALQDLISFRESRLKKI